MSTHEPDYKGSTGTGGVKTHVVVDVVLRVVLFATSLVALIVMVTSKQTKLVPVAPGMAISMVANFDQTPAFIYFIVAMSVACLYSIITGALSILALLKLKQGSMKLVFHFAILDTLLLGVLASATGAAGGVAYIGYKGNSHSRWNKVCNVFDSFCGHVVGSLAVSLLPSIALLLLVWLSVFMFSKKIRLN
ncbi:putative casparian strip membrane protein [Helianthus annuus]|nr:putative casparian strip membrane protein [Helianthus annuus]